LGRGFLKKPPPPNPTPKTFSKKELSPFMEKALLSLCWTIWYGMKTNLNKIQITEHLKFFEGFSRELFAKSSLEWGLGQSPGLTSL
jgi:hypothetical protein